MNTALIMAGGAGSRMKSKTRKQFLLLKGKSILEHTLEKFISHPEIDQIILVYPKAAEEEILEIQDKLKCPRLSITTGGKMRQESVINGLKACPKDTDIVLIHDGVRPFIDHELISSLISETKKYQAVIPVSRIKNTIKKVVNNVITDTVPREELFNALTPQVFDYKLIYEHHCKAAKLDVEFTDDSSILEYFNIPVHVIITQDSNLKITEPHDLKIAESLLIP